MFGNDGASPQFNTTSNTLTVAGTSYQLTTANSTASNGNDQNDSDATVASRSPVSAANGFPTISLTTPDAGANHTFDVGFVRQLATYSIAKTMDKKQVEKGQIVTYTVSLTNTSATTATSLVLTDQFSATATTLVGSATTSAGTFAPGASGGTWSLSSLAGGQSATLIFRAQLNEEGVIYNTVTAPNGQTATVCTSVPAHVCANESFQFDLTAPASYSTYQWTRNGIAIPGATSSTYSVTAIGEYSVQATSLGVPRRVSLPLHCRGRSRPKLNSTGRGRYLRRADTTSQRGHHPGGQQHGCCELQHHQRQQFHRRYPAVWHAPEPLGSSWRGAYRGAAEPGLGSGLHHPGLLGHWLLPGFGGEYSARKLCLPA